MMPRKPPMEPRMVTVMPYTRQKYDGMVCICRPAVALRLGCQDTTWETCIAYYPRSPDIVDNAAVSSGIVQSTWRSKTCIGIMQ